MTQTTAFNDMQTVKRHFFALRNGIIADTFRRAGASYKIVFGLNLPQIAEVASVTPHSPELAQALWDNSTTRESRLIAPMLYPAEKMDRATAIKWMSEINEAEVADILCMKLLRRLPFAAELVDEAAGSDSAWAAYTAMRLALNLLPSSADRARALAAEHKNSSDSTLRHLSVQIADELEFRGI